MLRTPFILITLLFASCNPVSPSKNDKSSVNMKNTIAPTAITHIVFSRDKGSVPPAFQRQYLYEITGEEIVYTVKDSNKELLETKKIALTPAQFTAICTLLNDQKINVPCAKLKDKEPMPPGGYSATVLMKAADKQLEHKYYVGGNKVYGCGDIRVFDKHLKALIAKG